MICQEDWGSGFGEKPGSPCTKRCLKSVRSLKERQRSFTDLITYRSSSHFSSSLTDQFLSPLWSVQAGSDQAFPVCRGCKYHLPSSWAQKQAPLCQWVFHSFLPCPSILDVLMFKIVNYSKIIKYSLIITMQSSMLCFYLGKRRHD